MPANTLKRAHKKPVHPGRSRYSVTKTGQHRPLIGHTNQVKNRRWVVGFTCYNSRFGCDCNAEVPKSTKNKFKKLFGVDHDDYCYHTIVDAPDARTAKLWAWGQQGATDEPHEIWEDVDVIAQVK
jgi:hypothetical protein